jgi:AcrR family transcriptional regulator
MARPGNPREKIMTAAARLFYEQGYNSTGINQVLEEAGVAKASLYSHFGSKDELGLAYLKEASREWFAAISKTLEKAESPVNKLLAAFEFLEKQLAGNAFRGCKFMNMLAEVDASGRALQQEVLEHKQQVRRFIAGLVNAALPPSGRKQASMLADTCYLLFEGAIIESKIHRDTWPVKAAEKAVKALLQQYR